MGGGPQCCAAALMNGGGHGFMLAERGNEGYRAAAWSGELCWRTGGKLPILAVKSVHQARTGTVGSQTSGTLMQQLFCVCSFLERIFLRTTYRFTDHHRLSTRDRIAGLCERSKDIMSVACADVRYIKRLIRCR